MRPLPFIHSLLHKRRVRGPLWAGHCSWCWENKGKKDSAWPFRELRDTSKGITTPWSERAPPRCVPGSREQSWASSYFVQGDESFIAAEPETLRWGLCPELGHIYSHRKHFCPSELPPSPNLGPLKKKKDRGSKFKGSREAGRRVLS